MSKVVEDFAVHCFLLAKGHYPELKDLTRTDALLALLAKYANIDSANVWDVWELVCEAFCRYVPERLKERFMIEMFSLHPEKMGYERLIGKMLGAIACTKFEDASFDESAKLCLGGAEDKKLSEKH